jgi:predicted transcriptional regulator
MISLTNAQKEVLHGIIDAYEVREVESVTIVDIAHNSGISLGLAGRLLSQLKTLGLVECNDNGIVVFADDNNGYIPGRE